MALRDALLNNDVLPVKAIVKFLKSKPDSQYYKDVLTIINNMYHIGINNKNDVIDRILPHIKSIDEDDFDDSNVVFVDNFIKRCINLESNSYCFNLLVNSYKYSTDADILNNLRDINSYYNKYIIWHVLNNMRISKYISKCIGTGYRGGKYTIKHNKYNYYITYDKNYKTLFLKLSYNSGSYHDMWPDMVFKYYPVLIDFLSLFTNYIRIITYPEYIVDNYKVGKYYNDCYGLIDNYKIKNENIHIFETRYLYDESEYDKYDNRGYKDVNKYDPRIYYKGEESDESEESDENDEYEKSDTGEESEEDVE